MRLNAIGIICGDLEASLRFYRALGVPFPDYDPEVGHYDGELDGFRLMLDSEAMVASFTPGFTSPQGNDRIGLAVECTTPLEVDATYDLLLASGFRGERQPFDAFWGQRYATVLDPDGNPVDLYATL